MKGVRIPIPPLEVQHEIVKILDTFSELGAELGAKLGAELEAQRKRYEYYRERLLSFEIGSRTGVSRIDELVAQKGVKQRAIGEFGELVRGSGIQKSDFIESGVGCIHYGQIHTHFGVYANETKSFVDPRFAARLRKAGKGDLVIATTSEDDRSVAKAVAWIGDENVAVSTDAYILRHPFNPKYLSYFFETEFFSEEEKKTHHGNQSTSHLW